MSCEQVDEQDLDTRYLAGTLGEAEAEAFESHFFACDRCWELVQQGVAIQAAHERTAPAEPPAGARVTSPAPSRRRHLDVRWGLAAAAVLILAGVGIWQLKPAGEVQVGDQLFRGATETLIVTPGAVGNAVTLAWPKVAQADLYRVRLYGPDGTLAAEKESGDTTVSLIMDTLPLAGLKEAFWEVQAMDDLRNPVARSPLTKAVFPESDR